MERCSLNTIIHEYVEDRPSDDSMIDVWLLGTSVEILGQISHSYSIAPKRRRRLASLILASGSDASNASCEFYCRSNEFTMPEFSCPPSLTGLCHFDFWQDKRRVPIGGSFIFSHRYLCSPSITGIYIIQKPESGSGNE